MWVCRGASGCSKDLDFLIGHDFVGMFNAERRDHRFQMMFPGLSHR